MPNRQDRRSQRPTNRRPVAKSEIRRGNFIIAVMVLVLLAPVVYVGWRAMASGPTAQASTLTPVYSKAQQDISSSDDVPTVAQPTPTVPENQNKTSPKPKKETYLELDMSQGKGLFTAWRIEPSDKITLTSTNQFKRACDLRPGDVIHMSQGLMGLVTKAEKYVDPDPNTDSTPDANGNVAERVIGWSKHITDTLLYLHTTNEVVGTTPEHPFFVHGHGWVKAGALRSGDQIETESADKLVTVVSTEVVHKRQAVYNLDVENTHTFYVGKDNLLVHNGDCVPEVQEALASKAPMQVTPGTSTLEGQYVDDLGRVQPWTAHYDEYGRLIARTDNNAANKVMGYDATHYHTYGYRGNPSGWGGQWEETGSHLPGAFKP